MPSRNDSWFHGHVAWYLRAVVWLAQAFAVGLVLRLALGTVGLRGIVPTAATGLATALLLFRQVDLHVKQALQD